MPGLTIPANKLKAALTHVATRDARYYLLGVYLEAAANGDLHIIATDGHRMFCGQLPGAAKDWPESHVTIPTDVVKRVAKKGDIELARDGNTWRLGNELFTPIDGVFPDWRRVVPSADQAAPAPGFTFSYLADAETAIGLWAGQRLPHVELRQHGEYASVVVGQDSTAFCLVMPKRAPKAGAGFAEPFKPSAARV